MSFLEEEYLRRISYKLRNFKPQGNHKFNFSCPICGDSSKKKSKARGYAFDKSGSLIIHCFNCGYGASFGNFLKEVDPLMYQDFAMEKFKNKSFKEAVNILPVINVPVETKKFIPNVFASLPLVSSLNKDHDAVKEINRRKIPDAEIYFAENFIEWSKGNNDKFKTWKDEDQRRLIFPFKAKDGRIIGYTARALDGHEPKYYRIFFDTDEKERFFGIDRLDESKQVYVLEGEIDSLFIKNAIAVSNGKLDTYYNPDAIYIPDVDIRNKEIMKGVEKLIDRNLKVSLLPHDLPGKDINELVINGFDSDKLLDIINSNVYQGLSGKLAFAKWKVV